MPSWNRLKVRRGDLFRSGFTFGQGFNTVRAVRVSVIVTPGTEDLEVRLDSLIEQGGPVYGEVEYKYVYVNNTGDYYAKSAASEATIRVTLESQGATVTVPADGSRDSQVNEIWLYRRGAGLDAFYRVAVAEVSGTGAVAIEDVMTARDALILGEKLEDNTTPPDDIIDIEGPYYDRIFALTATHLYPSRRLSPDNFSEGQVIRVAGADERALWVKKAISGLFIGTTKDIFVLNGTGAELPDGTIDFSLQGLNIDNPPISEAVAQEGNQLVYLAADGWRAISGAGSTLIVGPTSLLYKGKDRHGVEAINMSGRFRAAIARGELVTSTPEGSEVQSSTKLYRYRFGTPYWYRHVYGQSWKVVYREPDGVLLAADNEGFGWTLDDATLDGTEPIAVTMWTKSDDIGHPFARKDPYDLRFLLDTGGDAASIDLVLDEGNAVGTTLTANNPGIADALYNLTGVSSFRRIQFKVTGDFEAFRLTNVNLGHIALPLLQRGHIQPSNFSYPGVKTVMGLQLRLCTLGQEVTIIPVLDNVEDDEFVVTSEIDEPINYTHMFTYPGRQVQEMYLKLNGDVEMYAFEPLVTARRPLGTLVYDTGPMDLGAGEMIWPREVWMKVEGYDTLFVEPFFDGLRFGAVQVDIPKNLRGTAAKFRVPLPRGYKGRVPRFIITSCEPFFPYWFEFARKQTKAQIEKPPYRFNADWGGQVKA